jgi:uncharacterized membrane protein
MKGKTGIGLVLIVLGVVALACQGFNYTKREKILDIGPIEATAETQKNVPIPPLIGGLLIAGGLAVIVFARR